MYGNFLIFLIYILPTKKNNTGFPDLFSKYVMLTVDDFPGLLKFPDCDRTPLYHDTKFTNQENLGGNISDKNGPTYIYIFRSLYIDKIWGEISPIRTALHIYRSTKYIYISRRPRWLGRLFSCLLKSISRVQFSPSAHIRRDFFFHKKMISGKRESVS